MGSQVFYYAFHGAPQAVSFKVGGSFIIKVVISAMSKM